MSIIQIVLLFSLLALGAWIFSKDFLPWIKGIGLILITLGGYFVMFPEHANVMAHYLNVGRGADLLLYFFIIASFFFGISIYQKLKNLERAITILFREKAKNEAVTPDNFPDVSDKAGN